MGPTPSNLLFGEIELRKCWVGDWLGKLYKGMFFGNLGMAWPIVEMFLHPVGVFFAYLEAPSSHIRKNREFRFFIYFYYLTPDIPPWRPLC